MTALAAIAFLRSLAGFGFPLFAPAMYNALGYGKGDTILAIVAIVVGCPACVLTLLLPYKHLITLQTMAILVLWGANKECEPFRSSGPQRKWLILPIVKCISQCVRDCLRKHDTCLWSYSDKCYRSKLG
jgi:hypothetical protein